MKLTSLLSTLAVLLFATAASAQSDPSTGGSFGTSFNHNAVSGGAMAGTALIGQDASMTAPLPTQRSFWDKMTGRNRSASKVNARPTNDRRVWFGPQGTNIRGRSHSTTQPQSNNTRAGAPKVKASSSATNTNSSRWRLFGKK